MQSRGDIQLAANAGKREFGKMNKDSRTEIYNQIDRLTRLSRDLYGMGEVLDHAEGERATLDFLAHTAENMSREIEEIADQLQQVAIKEREKESD